MSHQSTKVYIPEPCHEDWNEMTPKEKGRFCDSCSKVVVDFTRMPTADIHSYLKDNSSNKVCGHFKKSQLDLPPVQITLNQGMFTMPMSQKFLLATFLVFGFTLYSTAQQQTRGEVMIKGNVAPTPVEIVIENQKVSSYLTKDSLEIINGQISTTPIEKPKAIELEEFLEGDVMYIEEPVEPVTKVEEIHELIDGEIMMEIIDEPKPIQEPVVEEPIMMLGKPAITVEPEPEVPIENVQPETHRYVKGDVKVATPIESNTEQPIIEVEKPNTFMRGLVVEAPIETEPTCTTHADRMPEFIGGREALVDYITKKIKYTRKAKKAKIEGPIYISFVVKKDGTIAESKVANGLGYGLDEIALEAIQKMPLWNPGEVKDAPVDVELTLPIQFSLK